MNSRLRGAVAVFAAMVACASTASAQGTVGKGSLGASIGVPMFLADEDTKEGQSARLIGQGHFQYVMSTRSRFALQFGYGWVGYKDGTLAPYKVVGPTTPDSTQLKDLMLTKFVPIEVSYLYAFAPHGSGWVPYAGAGVNLTRLEIVNDRDKIKDPATFDSYVNWAPGVQLRGGTEYFLPSNKNVAFDWNVHWAYLFSKNEESFPSGFTGPHSTLSVNFGVNVYFWPIGYKPIEVPKAPEEAATPPPAPGENIPPPSADPTPPPPPPTPETPSAPDTTRAPGQSTPKASTAAKAEAAKPAAGAAGATVVATKPAPAEKKPASTVAADDTTAAFCPVPEPASNGVGGMFGVPGPTPPAPARFPSPDGTPEEPATP